MKKGINKILLSIVSALLILMPFSYSIKADNILNHPYILGVRIKVLDVEYQNYKFEFSFNPTYKVKVGSQLWPYIGNDPTTGSIRYQNNTNMVTCGQSSHCELILEMDDKTIITDYNTHYIYEKTIIFNNHYVGTITIDNTPMAVNGTELTYTTMVNNENISICDINLTPLY